jgi:AAHS family 4-hydroxybenzoate transporter-like MFS transporter
VPAPPVPRTHILVASLCFLVLFLEGYDITAMSYATPSLIEQWQVKASAFTIAITAGSVGLLLGALVAGLLGDRLGRKPVLIGCVALFGGFSLLTALSTGLTGLAALRFLTGLGLGGGIPIAIALATDHAPARHPRRLVILMSAGVSVGNTLGGFMAGAFVKSFGWQAIFIAGGLLPLAVLPLLIMKMPNELIAPASIAGGGKPGPAALFEHGLGLRTLILWMVNFFNLVGNYFILFWLPAILHGQGLTPAAAIGATTFYALGSIVGALITAPIVDRLGIERVIAVILCLGAVCVLIIGSAAMPYAVLCLIIGLAGVGIGGCQHGINATSGALYPTQIRATGTGWALGVGRVGQIVGPLIGGLLLGAGWASQDIFRAASVPAFCVAAGMAALGWLRMREVAAARSRAAVAGE